MQLTEAAAARQTKHLLDQREAAQRALTALGEELGWTIKYAHQLTKDDEIVTARVEGPVTDVVRGPTGLLVRVGDIANHFDHEDLVTVIVHPGPEGF